MSAARWAVCALSLAGLGCVPISQCLTTEDCAVGSVCVEVGAVTAFTRVCTPILCTDDPGLCPGGSFCWPPPGSDPNGSLCTEVPACDGGSIFDGPACSAGTCGDGLTCGLTAGVGEQGEEILVCGCLPR